MRESSQAPPVDPRLRGLSSALGSQVLAVATDLWKLVDDAREQGRDVLGNIRSPQSTADTSLKAPDISDAPRAGLTMFVMVQGLMRHARDAADQIQRLLVPLSAVADPACLVFASQLDEFSRQIRPSNAPPGPYAPRSS
jgi:hypothetical protein